MEIKNVIDITWSMASKMVVSHVKDIWASIGGAWLVGTNWITTLATGIIGTAKTLTQAVEAVQTVVNIVKKIPERIDSKSDMNPYELGLKAEIANKSTGEFENVKQYLEYLRDDVKLDTGRLKALSDEDRVSYGIIGAGLYIKEIEEEYDIYAPGEFWRTVADMKLREEDVKTYIKVFKDNGIKDMSDMTNYIKGEKSTNGTDPQSISESLFLALKQLYPKCSEEELYKKIAELSLNK